ncbi:type II restriction endonuclease subunit M [Clostridium botulinum]|nr:type II restriction endonuclease subunit M [Clostridium botulinum]
MKYKNLSGKLIDTDKDKVECPWCHKVISKKDIDNDEVYHDGVCNSENDEEWCELMHEDCAEEASEWRRNKYGY